MSPKLTSMTQIIVVGLAVADDRGVGEVLKAAVPGWPRRLCHVDCYIGEGWPWCADPSQKCQGGQIQLIQSCQ
jgi:hypothetical protein